MINESLDRLQAFPANFQSVVPMTTSLLGETTGHSMSETTMLMIPLPPFSTLVAKVPFFSK